jgi:multidrug efflux pump subunit AcrA (membrane-fusion protein)
LVLDTDNKVSYRGVELGRSLDGLRIVRKGLKPGDIVVVSGLQRVRPGMAVSPKRVVMGAGLPQAVTADKTAAP